MNGINITRVGSIPSPYSSRRDKEESVARRVHPGCSFTAELFFTVPPIIHEHSIKLIDPTDVRSFFTAKKPQTVFFIFISREIPPSLLPGSVPSSSRTSIRHIFRHVSIFQSLRLKQIFGKKIFDPQIVNLFLHRYSFSMKFFT